MFDAKVSTLEERKELDRLTMHELHGILIAYEMRTDKEKPSTKEADFKASKGTKNRKHKSNESSIDELDEEEANFVIKLNTGSGKYKGKLHFRCSKCGRIGHFKISHPYHLNSFEIQGIEKFSFSWERKLELTCCDTSVE